MATYYQLTPFVPQFVDGSGNPLSNGTLSVYLAGTTTLSTLYTDDSGTATGANVTLNSYGYPSVSGNAVLLYAKFSETYKIVLKNSSGSTIYTIDDVGPLSSDTVLNAVNIAYTPAGTGATATTVKTALDRIIYAADFSGTFDGAADELTSISAAITHAETTGGTVVITGDYKLSGTITIPSGVTVDCRGFTCIPSAVGVNCFVVRPGGLLKNCKFNGEQATTGLGAYTGKFVTLQGTGAGNGFQGTVYRNPWLSNFSGRIDLDQDSGEHIYLDGSTQYLQEFIAENVSCRGGARGVHIYGDDPDNLDYAQGNVFIGATMHGVRRFIHCDGSGTNGNLFSGFELQQRNANPVCEVVIEGSQNVLTGIGWDDVAVTVSGDGNDLSNFVCTGEFGPSLTDTGTDNRLKSRGTAYYDKTSVNTEDDWRHEFRGQGKIEFRDFIIQGLDPRWSAASAGTATAAFSYDTYGAGAGTMHSASSWKVTLPANSDAYTLYFAGKRAFNTAQEMKVHFTVHSPVSSDGRCGWQVGLYGGANDSILLVQSFATYGDSAVRLLCKSGGTTTTTILYNGVSGTTSGSNRVYFCSLRISSTSVSAKVKTYDSSSSGATGRVSDGVLWTDINSTLFTGSSSTNIPTVNLEPYVYCVRSSGGSTGYFHLLDYQLIAGAKAAS